jgi:hypothetical protein
VGEGNSKSLFSVALGLGNGTKREETVRYTSRGTLAVNGNDKVRKRCGLKENSLISSPPAYGARD